MLISFVLMIIISNSLTVPTQPSPWFHVEAWLPFRNCEKDYCDSNPQTSRESNGPPQAFPTYNLKRSSDQNETFRTCSLIMNAYFDVNWMTLLLLI